MHQLGISGMQNAFEKACLPMPLMKSFQRGFKVVVFGELSDQSSKLENVIENQGVIKAMIAADPKISAQKIAVQLDKTERHIQRLLSTMQANGIIKRHGAKKRGLLGSGAISGAIGAKRPS